MESSRPDKRTPDISLLLAAVDRGDDGAFDALVTAVYPELKRLAHFQFARERDGHTLNTTAIVHEAFMRLRTSESSWNDAAHFYRAASRVMRHLLVDHARRRKAQKRGGDLAPFTLGENENPVDDDAALLAVDEAMRGLSQLDPRLEQIVECRFFAGLTVSDTAAALDIGVRTVEREWQRARGYLLHALETGTS